MTPVEELGPEEIERYRRHLSLPEVGWEGQRSLKSAKVLCVGAGGLGSPAAMYLAAAGVGTIGLVDFDRVELSNLHRQVLYDTGCVGLPKLESARRRLSAMNPHVDVRLHETRLSRENALDLIGGYELVLDGTDNFAARYLVNDACALLGKPNVHASIFRFEGQLSVFWAKKGPCYRCLHPEPPSMAPSCSEAGVLGALPGVLGTLQAIEALKLILGAGEPLIGKLLLFDALKMEFRKLDLRKDPACPTCGTAPRSRELEDVGRSCQSPAISAEELKGLLEAGRGLALLDVREPAEHRLRSLEGSKLIPLGELPRRAGELDPDAEWVVHCQSGARSARAVELLRKLGFSKARSLAGGLDAWS